MERYSVKIFFSKLGFHLEKDFRFKIKLDIFCMLVHVSGGRGHKTGLGIDRIWKVMEKTESQILSNTEISMGKTDRGRGGKQNGFKVIRNKMRMC